MMRDPVEAANLMELEELDEALERDNDWGVDGFGEVLWISPCNKVLRPPKAWK